MVMRDVWGGGERLCGGGLMETKREESVFGCTCVALGNDNKTNTQ